ncbi:MAG: metallophosphoesterase [Candidatus Njordarchaeales archaeon]
MLVGYLVDIHGRKDALRRVLERLKDVSVELVVVGGDVTDFDPVSTAMGILEMIKDSLGVNVYFIPGNCDDRRLLEWSGEGIYNLHLKEYRVGDLLLFGLGGSNVTPFHTNIEWSEDEIRKMLEGRDLGERSIFVSHGPPYGTRLDKVMRIKHVGSKELRKFIEEKQPLLVLTGHIHESAGIDRIGRSVLVNPGPARSGRYAVIELIPNEEPKVRMSKV